MVDISGYGSMEGLADDLDTSPPVRVNGSGGYRHLSTQSAEQCSSYQSSSSCHMADIFFPHLDQLSVAPDASSLSSSGSTSAAHMTDLTNSLPRHDAANSSLTAQAILAKLEASDLSSNLGQEVAEDPQRGLDSELFSSVYDDQYDAAATATVQAVAKPLEPTDVYGRVTCYDGKIVLQLRLLNLNTNFPINVSECWLCRNKVHGGSQMFAHKHVFQGAFQVNDEYIHVIIPETEPLVDPKSVFHSSFDGSQSIDFTKNIVASAASTDIDFEDDPLDSDDITLPYMAQAFGLTDKILDSRQSTSNSTTAGCGNKSYNSYAYNNYNSPGHGINSAVDNIYNMCNTNAAITSRGAVHSNLTNNIERVSQSENTLLHTLETLSSENRSSEIQKSKIQPSKKVETGARKRKSKAQKKTSVIRMKGDSPFDSVAYFTTDSEIINGDITQIDSSSNQTKLNSDASNKFLSTQKSSSETQIASRTSATNCSDTTLIQRSRKQLDANFNSVKSIIAKTEDVICKICEQKFGRNLSDFKKHMVDKHCEPEGSIYECPICIKKFGYNKHLVQHVKIHLGIKAFKCDKCGTTYGREETLKRHLMTHGQQRPHACSVCPKAFARAEYLKAHMQAHNRTRHVCHKCGVVCSSKFNLDIHLRKHSKDKPFLCELCNKSFVRSDFLDNHMEVVHKRNKPKCGVCGKSFSRKDVLKRHMSTHKELAFDCKFCLKTFSRKDRLLAHKRTHEVNSELKCSKCPAAFHRREVLLKHQKLHETKEQCHICFKFTISKEKLLVHLNWHKKVTSNRGDEKQNCHTCETCGKTLTRRDLLEKHIRRVHGRPVVEEEDNTYKTPLSAARDKQFNCDICSKGFTRSCNLRTHMLRLHSSKHQEDDEDDPDDLDSLNSALSKSRQNQSNLVDLSVWTNKHHKPESYQSQLANSSSTGSFGVNSGHSLLAVSNNPRVMDSYKENCSAWYPRSGSTSPAPHLPGNLSLQQLSNQHPHSPINLSAEAITAAAYLLAYPSYLGPY